MNKTRIVLADDHRVFREGLRRLLADEPDLEVVGEASDGRRAGEMAAELAPHVIVMDVSMPGLNGIDATRAIRKLPAPPHVVILSMHSDKRFVTESLQAGASGYVLKDAAFEELAGAIRTVRENGVYLSPRIAGVVAEEYRMRPGAHAAPTVTALSPREREVLQLLVEGNSAKQVASILHLNIKTVETHRRRIMERLDMHSFADLVKFAIREGITSAEK